MDVSERNGANTKDLVNASAEADPARADLGVVVSVAVLC